MGKDKGPGNKKKKSSPGGEVAGVSQRSKKRVTPTPIGQEAKDPVGTPSGGDSDQSVGRDSLGR